MATWRKPFSVLALLAAGVGVALVGADAGGAATQPVGKSGAPAPPRTAVADGDATSNLPARIDAVLRANDAYVYAGLEIADGRIAIHRLPQGADRVRQHTEATAADARRQGTTDARPLTYVDATNALQALEAGQQWIIDHAEEIRRNGIDVTIFGPLIADNRLRIGVTQVTPSTVRYFEDHLGADLVEVVESHTFVAASRNTDSVPWWGGDYINGPDQCTSGIPMKDGSGVTYNTTAGHCGGGTWYQNGQPYGIVITRSFYDYGPTDAESISTYPGWAAGRIYTGSATSETSYPVKTYSTGQASGETGICADGYRSAPEHCGGKILLTGQCVQWVTGLHTCNEILVVDYSFQVQPGDSGGPVYNHITSGTYAGGLNVRGLINGYYMPNPSIWVYTPITQVNRALGLSPLAG